MHSKARSPNSIFGMNWNSASTTLALMITLLILIFVTLFIMLSAQPAQGQTYQVIYNFTGGVDGAGPDAGLTMDNAGNLYGTTGGGGYTGGSCSPGGCGTVFKLSKQGSDWVFTPLYDFRGNDDGWCPEAVPTVGPDGSVYGTTTDGSPGGSFSAGLPPADECSEFCGTVFKLTPPPAPVPNALGGWTHTVLHNFQGPPNDGDQPYHSPVTIDSSGNLYVTTSLGGQDGWGTVVGLMRSNGGWTERVIHNFFLGSNDGGYPVAGVIFDNAGRLYGTTSYGYMYQRLNPHNSGVEPETLGRGMVFQLTPSGADWTEASLYNFPGGEYGGCPYGSLVFDHTGNLYGTSSGWCPDGNPTVFMLQHGTWAFDLLYDFTNDLSPVAGPTVDTSGNVYGTAYDIGGGNGAVFKLTPGEYGWTYTTLYDFPDCNLGCEPRGGVVVDATGNIFSTTSGGGRYNGGVVFEITP